MALGLTPEAKWRGCLKLIATAFVFGRYPGIVPKGFPLPLGVACFMLGDAAFVPALALEFAAFSNALMGCAPI